MVASEHFDAVLGSRILGTGARRGGMPLWKYVANRFLTLTENVLLGYKLSEYHTGYRAFSRRLLERLPLEENSDDFVFDNQMLAQALWFGFDIGELTCPTRYFTEASSINFRRSVKYGFGVLGTALEYRLARMGLAHPSPLLGRGAAARSARRLRRSGRYQSRRANRGWSVTGCGRPRRAACRRGRQSAPPAGTASSRAARGRTGR